MLLRFLKLYPLPCAAASREKLWGRLRDEVLSVARDNYERPILKIFDFTLWIESRLTCDTLPELLGRRKTGGA